MSEFLKYLPLYILGFLGGIIGLVLIVAYYVLLWLIPVGIVSGAIYLLVQALS